MHGKNYLIYSGEYASLIEANKDKLLAPLSANFIIVSKYERNINLIYPLVDKLVCEYIKNEIGKEITLEQAHNLFLDYFDGSLSSIIEALVLDYTIKSELRPILVYEKAKSGIVIYPILPSVELLQRQKLPSHYRFYRYYGIFSNFIMEFDEKNNPTFKILKL